MDARLQRVWVHYLHRNYLRSSKHFLFRDMPNNWSDFAILTAQKKYIKIVIDNNRILKSLKQYCLIL